MKQITFGAVTGFEKHRKVKRRAQSLAEMNQAAHSGSESNSIRGQCHIVSRCKQCDTDPVGSLMARYVERGITTYRTDELGALTLKFAADAKGVPLVSAYRNERRRYWLDLPVKEEGALD